MLQKETVLFFTKPNEMSAGGERILLDEANKNKIWKRNWVNNSCWGAWRSGLRTFSPKRKYREKDLWTCFTSVPAFQVFFTSNLKLQSIEKKNVWRCFKRHGWWVVKTVKYVLSPLEFLKSSPQIPWRKKRVAVMRLKELWSFSIWTLLLSWVCFQSSSAEE